MIDVVCAILVREQRILLAKKSDGQWEFPGGKIEPGETPEEALSRELFEELGIRVAPENALYVQEIEFHVAEVPHRLMAFEVTEFQSEPTAKLHDAVTWVDRQELPGYALMTNDKVLLEEYLTNIA